MFGEFGYFSLVIALFLSFLQALLPLVAILRRQYYWQANAVSLAMAASFCMLTSFACLVLAFLNNDFSLSYVAEHSNTLLPWYYKLSAVWGGHEGSMLLWAAIFAAWTLAVSGRSNTLPLQITGRLFCVMGAVAAAILSFIVLTSNPFLHALPALPVDGLDLNPLLQDVGLIIHPPILYSGYVGLVVPFALCIAGLWAGQLDSIWASWCRRWVLLSWSFLTLGIAIGSWWAYYELGWGGWWFWDPVENASLMPWLVATALLHSLLVTEKRGVFKAWTALLAILAFALSLMGTFLVRSGVLTSVHSFAADPDRGLFILCILCVVVGGGLLLFAVKGWQLNQESTYTLLSKESLLFVNNSILLVATSVVFLGTLYPLIAEVLNLGRLSVGPPYFNSFFTPLSWLMLVFMGVAPLTKWKLQSQQQWQSLLPALTAVLLTMFFVLLGFYLMVVGKHVLISCLTVVLVTWVWGLLCVGLMQKRKVTGALRGYLPMFLAHGGLLVVILGVSLTTHLSVEHDVAMRVGQTERIGAYTFKFDSLRQITAQNYDATQATFQVFKHDQLVAILKPEKKVYVAQQQPMTEAAIDGSVSRDLYVALGEPINPDQHHPEWAVRVYVKPFVRLLWLGALMMALGGFLAVFFRVGNRPVAGEGATLLAAGIHHDE